MRISLTDLGMEGVTEWLMVSSNRRAQGWVANRGFIAAVLAQKLQRAALPAVVFFYFFEGDEQDRAVKGEKINMPRDRSKEVDPGQWRVEK